MRGLVCSSVAQGRTRETVRLPFFPRHRTRAAHRQISTAVGRRLATYLISYLPNFEIVVASETLASLLPTVFFSAQLQIPEPPDKSLTYSLCGIHPGNPFAHPVRAPLSVLEGITRVRASRPYALPKPSLIEKDGTTKRSAVGELAVPGQPVRRWLTRQRSGGTVCDNQGSTGYPPSLQLEHRATLPQIPVKIVSAPTLPEQRRHAWMST